jgi:hypothetical protein
VAARSLAPPFTPLRQTGDVVVLGTTELVFTAGEAGSLVARLAGRPLARRDHEVLMRETRGWATALVLAAATAGQQRGDESAGTAVAGGDVIAHLTQLILDGRPTRDRLALGQLAHLVFFSPALCDAVAGAVGTFDRLVTAGVPFERTVSGWWELPGPVASHLAGLGELRADTVRTAAAYAAHGQPVHALRLLLDSALADEAAALLSGLAPDRVEDLGLTTVRGAVDALPQDAVATHPGVLLHLARTAETAHQLVWEIPARRHEHTDRAAGPRSRRPTSSPYGRPQVPSFTYGTCGAIVSLDHVGQGNSAHTKRPRQPPDTPLCVANPRTISRPRPLSPRTSSPNMGPTGAPPSATATRIAPCSRFSSTAKSPPRPDAVCRTALLASSLATRMMSSR